jgi:hypothetical protein
MSIPAKLHHVHPIQVPHQLLQLNRLPPLIPKTAAATATAANDNVNVAVAHITVPCCPIACV